MPALSLSLMDRNMPASQHQSPKSDIEISQAAKKRLILDVAKEKLGIGPENLEPYGHYKAKVSMDYIKSLKDKPNGKLILVSAITPTPAGEGKTTTRSTTSARRPCSACVSRRLVRRSA
jgi:formate--tetrahydrofolate ligase